MFTSKVTCVVEFCINALVLRILNGDERRQRQLFEFSTKGFGVRVRWYVPASGSEFLMSSVGVGAGERGERGDGGAGEGGSGAVCNERVPGRRLRPQSVVSRLVARETWGSVRAGAHWQVARQFYQTVFPNCTVVNVEKPPCFLRKFSPDGAHFIAFSADQTSLEVFLLIFTLEDGAFDTIQL